MSNLLERKEIERDSAKFKKERRKTGANQLVLREIAISSAKC